MPGMTDTDYPGSNADPEDVIALADEYGAAATTLFENNGRKGDHLSRAPARLCAIQAIELYLNAYLRCQGEKPETVRGYFHDLAERADHKSIEKLRLKKRTSLHLSELTKRREYLVARYAPELASTQTEINRVRATLVEVANKVKTQMNLNSCVTGPEEVYNLPETRSQNSPRSLVRGNGMSGTGTSRNVHNGSQPSLT